MKGLILNDMGGDVMYVSENVTGALREQMKHHEPIACYSLDGYNVDANSDSYKTLTAGRNDTHNIPVTCYAIEGNTVDRASGKNGKGYCENVSPTLNTQDRHAVVFALEGNGSRPSHMGKGYSDDGKMYTLNTIEQHSVCYEEIK